MSGLEFALLVAAGGFGAGGRYLLDSWIMRGRARGQDAFPLGILVVNVTGSFALGVLTGLGAAMGPWAAIIGVGLLGGYTTFSTVSVETVLLAQRRRRDWAWKNLLLTLVAAVIAAGLGLLLSRLLPL